MGWGGGDGKARRGVAGGGSARRCSPASRGGRSERSLANGGGASLRSSSRYSEPLDGDGGTGRTTGAESTTARTTCGCAIGTASSSHDGAPHSQRLAGPVELALCAVDQRSGARVAVAKVRGAGFGVDGRTLFAGLGSDPAEAGAPSVRTKSDRGAEMAGGRISLDSSPGTTV